MRVLIVEDNPEREAILRRWIPEGFRAVVAKSAGAAIGLLRLDAGDVYAAILLDHDLQERTSLPSDRERSGRDVVDAVIRYVSKSVPVLVHSMNPTGAALMVQALHRAGFKVTQMPMAELDGAFFSAWLEGARRRRMGDGEDAED